MIVNLDFGEDGFDERVEEVVRLVEAVGVKRHRLIKGKRPRPDPKFFAGSGKVEEIGRAVEELGAAFIVFNHELSPAQQRNIERQLDPLGPPRVFDRTELILEIFAQRAQTNEGKLQVELARLQHLSTRLVRGWTHLERQRGGFGRTGGPGETQLELDRRYIAKRVKTLKARLADFEKRRTVQRRARARGDVLSVSIVGYTNAGKSTLFNALARQQAYAADQLFATLDTTTRRIWLPPANPVVLSDTVGFIRELPHDLVAAFSATLSEAADADLLLHVIDASAPNRDEQIAAVDAVLLDIGAADVPQLRVYNKCDIAQLPPGVERDACGNIYTVRTSALTGAGCADLRTALGERFPREQRTPTIPSSESMPALSR